MLKVILQDSNQQKPITFSVKRWNDLFVEFHSWYLFEFKDWYLDITDTETQKKWRVRYAANAKIWNDVLALLKDWLNKDFNSWIVIKDDTEEDSEPTDEEDWWEALWNAWQDSDWSVDDNDVNEWDSSEEESKWAKTQSTKKLPWWAAVQKK